MNAASLDNTTFTSNAGLPTGPVSVEPYRSPEFYRLEREMVFKRAWLLLGRVEELPKPGDFVVKKIDIAGVSVVVTRSKESQFRSFFNTCSHRGSEVVLQQEGNATRFVCPYHNWTYANDGRLIAIPDEVSFFSVDKKKCGLAPIATEIWEGWIFINLSPEPQVTLREFLGPLADRLSGLKYPAAGTPVVIQATLEANWKVVCDAFLEAYHIPAIHPETIGSTFASPSNPFAHMLDAQCLGAHRFLSTYGNPQYTPKPSAKVERLGQAADSTASVISASGDADLADFLRHSAINPTRSASWAQDVYHIFPNTHLDVGPGGFWTHQFWPTSERTTKWEGRFYVPPARTVGERFRQELYVSRVNEVILEDLANVPRTQRGVDSRGKTVMQLQDNEIGIRHMLHTLHKWVGADTVRQALS